jgi:hypothetical protein
MCLSLLQQLVYQSQEALGWFTGFILCVHVQKDEEELSTPTAFGEI